MRNLSSIRLTLIAGFICFGLELAHGNLNLPANLPGDWSVIGRTKIQRTTNSVIVKGGYLVDGQHWKDTIITFRAKAPTNAEEVQIWAGFRYRDRDSRYVFALRGGHDNDLYLARYAPDGGAKFLGFVPLNFKPALDTWYRFKVVVFDKHIQIYLNDETVPRINITDANALWENGSICLGGGWLPAEFADLQVKNLTDAERSTALALGDKQWTPPMPNKDAERKLERAAYKPAKVTALSQLRTEISLNGNWLFEPDYQLPKGKQPVELNYDDSQWHIMPVPQFWTPGLSWLYGETGFPDLPGVASTKGIADSLVVNEMDRCDSYTFNWRKTKSAWYRHYLELPSNLGDRHFELDFDAIAKISEVWVNGIQVGAHTGMFGELKCDVTKALRPGKNIIVVHVVAAHLDKPASDVVEGMAVTVEVTSSMLHSLPHGMYQDNVGGIWQPVKLTASAPIFTSDCFVMPDLHEAKINLQITNSGSSAQEINVSYKISSTKDGSVLYSSNDVQSVSILAGQAKELNLSTPYLNPQTWSPQSPNLYDLKILLSQQQQVIDIQKVRFGFRTFSVDGSKFLLNGHPFWLRGANPFPNTLQPNDAALARRFLTIAHDGNVRVTRTHIVPYASTWLDAADETGMAVSFEGTWPWLMLNGNPPDDELINDWREEFISLVHKYRNHPSIILWTVNNEMKFERMDQQHTNLLKQKWSILDKAIKAIRATDPTRPVVADSAYVRDEAREGYLSVVKPEHFDDGDVDDRHSYNGWYEPSFFHLNNGEFTANASPNRPFISQELSTGYPNNDDGHPVRFYLFKNYTPQALVGDDAYENADPNIFLTRQAFMTKELTESMRRNNRETCSGALLFSYLAWFQSPWDCDQIKPWPAYYALKTAMQPVLVSAELYGRHFYTGKTVQSRVCIINDKEDFSALPALQLQWKFQDHDRILSEWQVKVPPVNYYQNRWLNVAFITPDKLPSPRVDGQLVLQLKIPDGKIVSQNAYDVVLTTKEWANNNSKNANVNAHRLLFWNSGNSNAMESLGIQAKTISSIDSIDSTNILIIGERNGNSMTSAEINELKSFVYRGGRALMFHPRAGLLKIFPEHVKSYVPKQGEIVTMHVPESPVFWGIEPLDLSWFNQGNRKLPIACSGVFRIVSPDDNALALAQQCDLHGYLKKTSQIVNYQGTPLVEIHHGKGVLIASEMCVEEGGEDPIAEKLLNNILYYLTSLN